MPGSQDADARALRALAEVIASAPAGTVRDEAIVLFEHALPTSGRVHLLRPLAGVMLACDAAVRAGLVDDVMGVYRRVADDLWQSFGERGSDPSWPWPEDVLTYENELLPQALLTAGRRLDRPSMAQAGLRVLDWLIDVQIDAEGQLCVVGNAGWWPRGGRAARYDQQPISPTTLLLAAETAYMATGVRRYRDAVESAYGWFMGRNDAHAPVAEPETGACGDGIGPAGVSRNQGAESTLMWLIALEHVRGLRGRGARADGMSSEAPMAAS